MHVSILRETCIEISDHDHTYTNYKDKKKATLFLIVLNLASLASLLDDVKYTKRTRQGCMHV